MPPATTYHTGPSPRAVADTTHDISWAELLRRLSSYEGCVLDRMLAEAHDCGRICAHHREAS